MLFTDDMHFSDEELSRILTAHANGQLCRCGMAWQSLPLVAGSFYSRTPDHMTDNQVEGAACVNQAAFLIEDPMKARWANESTASWFDKKYKKTWGVNKFLNELTKMGWA